MDKKINLLFSLDKNCFDGLLITLLSLAKNTSHPLNVFIATGTFILEKKKYEAFTLKQADFIKKVIQEENPQSEIYLIDISEELMRVLGKSVNLTSDYSPYTLVRLLSDCHPEFGNRLLYLDVDLVITGDIYQVYSYDLEGKEIGMVRDAVGSHFLGRNYCNAGVLLMDLETIRQSHHFDRVRDKVIHHRYFMPDQTALNRGMKNYIKMMPSNFNDQHDLHENTIVRHYCKWVKIHRWGIGDVTIKPWQVEEFRKRYGEDTHREILDEFLQLKKEYSS